MTPPVTFDPARVHLVDVPHSGDDMDGRWLCIFGVLLVTGHVSGRRTDEQSAKDREMLVKSVHRLVKHYQQDDPVGLPGLSVPEPMPIPEVKRFTAMGMLLLKDMEVSGLSRFRFKHIKSHISALKVDLSVNVERVHVTGNCSITGFLHRWTGVFICELQNVTLDLTAVFGVDRNGTLQAYDIGVKAFLKHVSLDLPGAPIRALVKGLSDIMGPFIFDSIKPHIRSQVNSEVRTKMNDQLVQMMPMRFPSSVSPFDMALFRLRNHVREMLMDPMTDFRNYTYTSGILRLTLSNISIVGLSSFYRTGDVALDVVDHVLYARGDMSTQRIEGACDWEVLATTFAKKSGQISFSVSNVRLIASIGQALDIRKHPRLDHFDLQVGNIDARMVGLGTLDYVAEFVLNSVPNVLKFTLEDPIKRQLVGFLKKVDLQKMLNQYLPPPNDKTDMDNYGA